MHTSDRDRGVVLAAAIASLAASACWALCRLPADLTERALSKKLGRVDAHEPSANGSRRGSQSSGDDGDSANLLEKVLADAAAIAAREPLLRRFIRHHLTRHSSLEHMLASVIGHKLDGVCGHDARTWTRLLRRAYESLDYDDDGRSPGALAAEDLAAACDRDPACLGPAHALLFLKGFQGVQAHRISRCFWRSGRRELALALGLGMSERWGVDIHPAARLGGGLLIDHATGVVIGETCVVGEDCTILQGVTLGGTGKDASHDRHPKISRDVLIGAGATILGNICIGTGAKIGAGSVVVKPIPAAATAVGVPARVVGRTQETCAGKAMDHALTMVETFRDKENDKHAANAAWHDIWADVLDVGVSEPGFVSREELRVRLAKFGCTEAEADAVFWKLDMNLDNKVDEGEFRSNWESAVREVCPKRLCAAMRGELGDGRREARKEE